MQLRSRAALLGFFAVFFLAGCNVDSGTKTAGNSKDKHEDRAEESDGDEAKDECESLTDDEKWSQAIDCYSRRIDLDKKDKDALVWRAYCYSYINNWPKCIEDSKAVIALNPTSDSAYSYLGGAYEGLKKYPEAEAAYKKAIELDPDDPDLYAQYGSMLQDMKRYDESIAQYTKAIDLSDEDEDKDNLTSRGWGYLLKGDPQKAIADFDKVTGSDKEYSTAYLDRAEAYYRLHLPERAIKEYTQALDIAPDDFDSYLQRGCTQLVTGQEGAALKDFDFVYNHSGDGDEDQNWIRGGLYEALLETKKGNAAAAKQILADIGTRINKSAWPVPLYLYETKKIDAKQLLNLAISPEEQTQAHAYIGWSARAHGDEKVAASEFDWVKKNGAQTEAEYIIAEAPAPTK